MADKQSKKGSKEVSNTFKRIESEHPLANCKPRGDRVVVQRDIAKKESAGGILLPDSVTRQKMPTGTVVRVGPGRYEQGRLVPVDLKEGDRVILTNYAGLEIRDPGVSRNQEDEFVILREEDIVAVL